MQTAEDQWPTLLTIAEVARLLAISRSTVKRRVADGSIRSIRLGRLVRVSEKEVARLIDS